MSFSKAKIIFIGARQLNLKLKLANVTSGLIIAVLELNTVRLA